VAEDDGKMYNENLGRIGAILVLSASTSRSSPSSCWATRHAAAVLGLLNEIAAAPVAA
jgi:hypothetical protein